MGPEMTFNTDLQSPTVLEGFRQLAHSLSDIRANQILLLKSGAAAMNGLTRLGVKSQFVT